MFYVEANPALVGDSAGLVRKSLSYNRQRWCQRQPWPLNRDDVPQALHKNHVVRHHRHETAKYRQVPQGRCRGFDPD